MLVCICCTSPAEYLSIVKVRLGIILNVLPWCVLHQCSAWITSWAHSVAHLPIGYFYIVEERLCTRSIVRSCPLPMVYFTSVLSQCCTSSWRVFLCCWSKVVHHVHCIVLPMVYFTSVGRSRGPQWAHASACLLFFLMLPTLLSSHIGEDQLNYALIIFKTQKDGYICPPL